MTPDLAGRSHITCHKHPAAAIRITTDGAAAGPTFPLRSGTAYDAQKVADAFAERFLSGPDLQKVIDMENKRQKVEGNPVGSLKRHFQAWVDLGCSPIALEWISQGVPMLFSSPPSPGGEHRAERRTRCRS